MPIVLVTVEGAEASGYTYDDQTGVEYEYPTKYKNMIAPGDPFVYSKKGGGGYFGAGIIGEIRPSVTAGRLVCAIEGYEAFAMPVPLKAVDGHYYEARPDEGKLNVWFAQGVRPISDERFEKLISAAAINQLAIPASPSKPGGGASAYASKAVADAVERASMNVALSWLNSHYYGLEVVEMPHNHPGFDIRVGPADSPVLHVEVKGTQAAEPGFWISEGERLHSIKNENHYLLIVVSGIDLSGGHAPVIHTHSGRIDEKKFSLQPTQWRGKLIAS